MSETEASRYVGHYLTYRTSLGWEMMVSEKHSVQWLAREPKYSEETCPNVASFTTNPTYRDPGSNKGLRGGKSEISHLRNVTATV
jgi:hypothetical protein